MKLNWKVQGVWGGRFKPKKPSMGVGDGNFLQQHICSELNMSTYHLLDFLMYLMFCGQNKAISNNLLFQVITCRIQCKATEQVD